MSENAITSEGINEFARIYPQGLEAEEALDLVFDDENLSQYHRSFIHVERKSRLEDSESEQSTTARYTSPIPQYWAGYYSLALHDPVENKMSVGWRLGKGVSAKHADAVSVKDGGVDLLLICPGKSSRQVAPVHARIRFHDLSGAIMLFGVQEGKPVSYQIHDEAKPRLLTNGQGHVLYQSRNSFTVGRLHYVLVFTHFNDEQYSSFVEKRNALIYGALTPHLQLSAVPRPTDVKRGLFITHGTMGHGAFGRVLPAVDAHTGEPLAVKQQQPTNQHQMDMIVREADLGAMFKVRRVLEYFTHKLNSVQESRGLLPTLKIWCEHKFENPCNILPQFVFTSSPLAICDFSQLGWEISEFTNVQVLEAFRGPLEGLCNLHAAGFMHRDVTRKNLLMMSFNPPRAVLADFGKAVKADTSKDNHIGPAHTRAPEVDGKTSYNNKIDVWSLGFAWMNVLFSHLQPKGAHLLSIDSWHHSAMEILNQPGDDGGFEDELAALLLGMLAWNPAKRISAAQALKSPCFLPDSSPTSLPHLPASNPKPAAGFAAKSSMIPSLSQRDSHLASGSDCGPSIHQNELQRKPAEVSSKKSRLY